MSCLSWQRLALVLPLWGLAVAGTAHAQEPQPDAPEPIDDPKLERRLGTRVDLAPAVTGDAGAGAPAPTSAAPAVELLVPGAPEQDDVSPEGSTPPRKPRLKLAYRRFTFAQIGATTMTTPAQDEPFNVVSLDFYPVSSIIRFGLTGQYGWQEGTFRQNGDAFFAGGTSLGVQSPGPVLTPFVEGYAFAGLMQRTKAGLGLNSIASALGELGIDAGTEAFLATNFCLTFALGYVHLANGYVRNNSFESFSVDTWSFKLGIGL